MFAFISDIHANIEALTAVLEAIAKRGVQDIYCLGDVIGYGPNPVECLELVKQRCRLCLMGNHDFAALYEPHNFNPGAEQSAYWTRAQLEADTDTLRRGNRWQFLVSLPPRATVTLSGNEVVLVHGSPRRPINEYIFPDETKTNAAKFSQLFSRIESLCFCGHTHVPGVFLEGPDFERPADFKDKYRWDGQEKVIINPGSVGQPRDRDPRASFVIWAGDTIEFHRVAYDVDATVRKIRAIRELDPFLAARLREGK